MMKKVYIVLFAILYFVVALTSTLHAVEFFGLSNGNWMAIMLACAFEIGQAAVLFALLTSPKDRSKVMPWVLMSIFTIVQVIGNVYASYKYITLHSMDLLQYFKEPIFVWTNIPDAQANVIITYICGGVLPLCALALTGMVTNYIGNDEQQKEQEIEEKIEEKVEKEIEEKVENEQLPYVSHPQVLPKLVPEIKPDDNLPKAEITHIDPVYDERIGGPNNEPEPELPSEEEINELHNIIEKPTEQPTVEISKDVEDVFDGPIIPEVNFPKQKSHFVNI